MARRLWQDLGSEAAASVRLCLEECHRIGDETAAIFLNDVAGRLEVVMREDGARAPSETSVDCSKLSPASRVWVLMQRIEWYRHRAMQAECSAAGSEAHREEMLDLALQWLDLARQAELFAKSTMSIG